jgi:hypothetical protein
LAHILGPVRKNSSTENSAQDKDQWDTLGTGPIRRLKIYLTRGTTDIFGGGTRVRSKTGHMGGSRLSCARYTQDPKNWALRDSRCPWERGCVIPWRRPSWVRIPPPAPHHINSSRAHEGVPRKVRWDLNLKDGAPAAHHPQLHRTPDYFTRLALSPIESPTQKSDLVAFRPWRSLSPATTLFPTSIKWAK